MSSTKNKPTLIVGSDKEMNGNELVAFEKQLGKFDKDTLTCWIASQCTDWDEEHREAVIRSLCMIEAMIIPQQNKETGGADFDGTAPASATDEL